jgi:SAM-dependent methyltransferase
MLDMFRRQQENAPDESAGADEVLLRSHIFQKLLKRLSARERPTLLDLGCLSGANIEIFARLGCRVQVEDFVSSLAETCAVSEPSLAAALPATEEAPHPNGNGGPPSIARAAEVAGGPPVSPAAAGPAVSSSTTAPGGRPSRRIVLPPRTFGRALPAKPASGPKAPYRSPLPAALSYPDASLDAIVAWDLLNYYDPESMRRIAAEVSRVLKPGGILFAYFHSRMQDTLEAPQRFRIVDEKQLSVEPGTRRPLRRHVLQNRDIEKLFVGLRIRELYFLKNGLREMLLEKTAGAAPETPPAARPRPRFQID